MRLGPGQDRSAPASGGGGSATDDSTDATDTTEEPQGGRARTAPRNRADSTGADYSDDGGGGDNDGILGDVRDTAEDAADAVGDTVDKAADVVGDAADQVRDTAGDVAEGTGDIIDRAEQTANSVTAAPGTPGTGDPQQADQRRQPESPGSRPSLDGIDDTTTATVRDTVTEPAAETVRTRVVEPLQDLSETRITQQSNLPITGTVGARSDRAERVAEGAATAVNIPAAIDTAFAGAQAGEYVARGADDGVGEVGSRVGAVGEAAGYYGRRAAQSARQNPFETAGAIAAGTVLGSGAAAAGRAGLRTARNADISAPSMSGPGELLRDTRGQGRFPDGRRQKQRQRERGEEDDFDPRELRDDSIEDRLEEQLQMTEPGRRQRQREREMAVDDARRQARQETDSTEAARERMAELLDESDVVDDEFVESIRPARTRSRTDTREMTAAADELTGGLFETAAAAFGSQQPDFALGATAPAQTVNDTDLVAGDRFALQEQAATASRSATDTQSTTATADMTRSPTVTASGVTTSQQPRVRVPVPEDSDDDGGLPGINVDEDTFDSGIASAADLFRR